MEAQAGRVLWTSPLAAQRLSAARAFLRGLDAAAPALILAPSPAAALWLVAHTLAPGSARFAWRRRTLDALALELALPGLARAECAPVRGLGLQALCARVVHELGNQRALGRFASLQDRPSFVRVLTATLDELRLAGVHAGALAEHDPELGRILAGYAAAFERERLADRALTLAAATQRAREGGALAGVGCALLALDVPLVHAAEAELVAALAAHARAACVTVPLGDVRSHAGWRAALGEHGIERKLEPEAVHDLARLQRHLFTSAPLPGLDPAEEARVSIVSSPGESRESVEVARGVLEAAARGVPFDRMAVAVRAVENYRAVLEEALARAQIPAHFADGVRRPVAQGRAFNALLECAGKGLSARSFAEFLSLGVLRAGVGESGPESGGRGGFVSPRKWERLLVEAAVVGGRARWTRRLRGLGRALEAELQHIEPDEPRRESLQNELRLLAELERFATPLLDALAELPQRGSWSQWLAALDSLARLALHEPDSVCDVLAELAPLGPIGPVSLADVRRLLSPRLGSSIVRSRGYGAGKVFVASIDELRGRSFDVVFVLGLAEKVFPPRIVQDPLLPDRVRRLLVPAPALTEERVARERLALRLAVGAASERVVLSFPRFDVEHGRPRVPSFYGLEVLQAIHGVLPAFDELTRRAEVGAAPRMGWPAPREPERAIDDAEYDLAVLDRWRSPGPGRTGAARYLLEANPHLARALRFRYSRWQLPRFVAADGFVVGDETARASLAAYALSARTYSATSLATFAGCPYRFYLRALARVAEREPFSEIDELDARQRGVLFHAVQRSVVEALLEAGLTLAPEQWPEARAILEQRFELLLGQAREEYAPAIGPVFDAALASLRLDLEGWLRRMLEERRWLPKSPELVFEAQLDSGLRIAGAVDLVEQHVNLDEEQRPVLRATDYKTGAVPERLGTTTGGKVLQPLLYALALERAFPGASVSAGRLYYCTSRAKFESHEVPLTAATRQIADTLVSGIDAMLRAGFLPAAPAQGECEHCAYRVVCGPYEEERMLRIKAGDAARLEPLFRVRRLA